MSSYDLAKYLRINAVKMSNLSGAAHLASALSCSDMLAVLYYDVLNINPKLPHWNLRDRFILSKGHAASVLYAALAYKGYFKESELLNYGKKGSLLEEHPSPKLFGVEAATGSLGHGLSIACGIALAGIINKLDYRTFIIMSDGECNEGSVWEALMFASAKKLGGLCGFVDYNKWQATDRSQNVLALEPFVDKFKSFGWNVKEIDGHNHDQIKIAVRDVTLTNKSPTMIIAHTIKGKGVSFMEDNNNWHYRIPTLDEVKVAIMEIEKL